jgi:hypothetical protein
MSKIEDEFIDYLVRNNFIFKNEEIYTECVKNQEGFFLLGEKFGPFEKGKKYKLKLFLSIPFIENNILTVDPKEKCDNLDVQRFAIGERDDQHLVRREDYFLNKLKEFKLFMEKEVKDGLKPKAELDRFNSFTTNIIDSRLLKLIRLAKSELSLEDEKKLTKSEQILFRYLYTIVNLWRNFFLGKNQSNEN